MAKTFLTLAAVLLAAMTVLASVAAAGSSSRDGYGGARGYGGPLGVGPSFGAPSNSYSPSKSYSPKRSTKKRTYTRSKKRKTTPDNKVDTAKTTPAELETETDEENSTISAASAETNEAVVKNTVDTKAKPKDEPKTTRKVACKKFFPSVGMTLTVACEEDG